MRRISSVAILVCLFAGAFLFVSHFAFSEDGGTKPPGASDGAKPDGKDAGGEELQARIGKLIVQLGSAEFTEREAAQKELSEIGEPTRDALTKAVKNDDPEIALRAEQLLALLNRAFVTLEIKDTKGKAVAGKKVEVSLVAEESEQSFGGPGGAGPKKGAQQKPVQIEETLPDDGRLAMPPVEPGTYLARITVEGYCTVSTTMTLGQGRYVKKIEVFKGGSIKGKVVDVKDGNKGVADVTLQIYLQGDSRNVTTDKNGEFVMEQVSPGKQYLYIRDDEQKYVLAEGDKGRSAEVEVKDEETVEFTIKMMEEKWRYGSIEGKVVTPDGKPYAGNLAVTCRPETSERRGESGNGGEAKADENGRFKVEKLEVGKYTVIILVNGFAAYTVRGVEVKGNEAANLAAEVKLEKGTALKIKVLDAQGKPMAETHVLLSNTEDPPRVLDQYMFVEDRVEKTSAWNSVKTDKDGCCEFALVEGKYAVRAYDNGNGMSEEAVVEVKAGGQAASLEINYKNTGTIDLAAVDKETGKPVEKVDGEYYSGLTKMFGPREAEVKDGNHIQLQEYVSHALQDGQGHFSLPASHKGDKVLLTAEGYKPAVYSIEDVPVGKTTGATCRMEKAGTGDLKATLVAGKDFKLESIAEVYVNSPDTLIQTMMGGPGDISSLAFKWGTKVTVSKEGVIEAKGLAEGANYVSLFDKSGRLLGIVKTIVEKGKVADVKMNLPGMGKVEGTLTDAAGVKMAGATVLLMPDSFTMSILMLLLAVPRHQQPMVEPPMVMPTAITDEKGRFKFDEVPEGNYYVVPGGQAGMAEIWPLAVKAGDAAKADVQLHESLDVALTFKKEPEGHEGAILVEKGANPLGIVIPPCRGVMINSRRDNAWKLTGVRPGKHIIAVLGDRPFGLLQEIEVKADTKSIEIESLIEMGGLSIKGKITQVSSVFFVPPGLGMVVAKGEHWFALGIVLPDGSFEIRGLHPGKYRLIPLSLDDACTNRADVIPVKEVTLEEGKNLEGVTIP